MTSAVPFYGFSKQTLTFFSNLAKNNTKMWFDQNKDLYERQVLVPSRDFIPAMGDRLKKIAPRVQADPRVNKSLFRLNRDIRFSPDKTPYKTHLGIWFWEGTRPRMECSGFYFHLEPRRFMLGVGLYAFPKDMLEAYRQSVVHPKYGPALTKAIMAIKKNKEYYLGEQHYKKIPQGYDPAHKNAEFLLYTGLYAGVELPVSEELFSEGLVDLCFKNYQKMLPLHRWLLDLTQRV
jgi:uncharacterized protein (TIGR02453 family)